METITAAEFQRRYAMPTAPDSAAPLPPCFSPPPAMHFRSRLEAAFAALLAEQRERGEVASWDYEPLRFRLADRCFYTPDFVVRYRDGTLIAFEVKGYTKNMRAGRNAWKMAAEQNVIPTLQFVWVTRRAGQWQYETYGSACCAK